MKLLIIGSDQVWSLEKIYYKHLKEMQVEVSLFPAQNYFYEYYNQSIVNKLVFRFGISGIIKKINEQLIEKVKQEKPDVIWAFKGMEILPSTLQWLKTEKIFLVNYNPDNPFIFSGAGSGNKNVKKSIPLYDLHLTYNLEVKSRLESLGCKTGFLPFGFELSNELYDETCEQAEIIKACFVGNVDKERAVFILELAKNGVGIDIYGHYSAKFVDHPSISFFPAVYQNDFWKTLRRYRVQLNFMRVHNLNSHNMRTFEIPGVGGIMVAPKTIEHSMFFVDNKEAFLFTDAKDCTDKINYLLGLSITDAQSIRTAARKRSLESKYDYKSRTMDAQKMIEENIKGEV